MFGSFLERNLHSPVHEESLNTVIAEQTLRLIPWPLASPWGTGSGLYYGNDSRFRQKYLSISFDSTLICNAFAI